MWQVWATWWEGIHCSRRAGPAHTNIPGTAKEVCLLHPARLQGRPPRTGRGQVGDVMPCLPSSLLPVLSPQREAGESPSKVASSPRVFVL